MSGGGLSRARLGRMHDVMAGYVERGDVPGLVTLVSRRGEVHVDAIGTMAAGGGDPMRRDTIVRIASAAALGHARSESNRRRWLGDEDGGVNELGAMPVASTARLRRASGAVTIEGEPV